MSLDRCIRTIIAETGTTLPKEDVAQVVDMLIQYDIHPRNRQVFGPFSPEQGRIQAALENPQSLQLTQARDIMVARARLVAAQQAANIVMDMQKRVERVATYRDAPSIALGMQAKLVGTNTPFLGSRNSAAAVVEGNTHNLVGQFDRELKQAYLDREFASRAMERDWARELYELNRNNPNQPGNPGLTNNPRALQMATIIQNLQRRSVEMINREGGFIGSYDGYISRSSHTADMLRQMGPDAWIGLAHQHFDIDMMYPNRPQQFIDGQLRLQFNRIVSGMHDSYDPANLDLVPHIPGQNLAAKVSEARVIHFKDAQHWLDYMASASEYSPTQAVFRSAQNAARDAGLMRVWGTNPKAALETDLIMQKQYARDRSDFDTIEELNQQGRNYDLWMKYLTGEANHIHNRTWAMITANTLAVQRLAKLGFLPFAQLTDLASLGGELRYQGVPFLNRMTGSFMGYFRGGITSEKRQVADLLNAYIEGEMQNYGSLMETNDPRISGTFSGTLNRLQQIFFRYTGAEAMTNRARGSFMYMMSRHMGQHHGMDWNLVGESERRIMRAFDIGEHEWNALGSAPWTRGVEGNLYLTPRDALAIPDAAIDAYNLATGRTAEYGEFRNEIATRLYSYYADRMNYGVLNPGVAERAIMFQGAAPGSPLGVTLRLISQFKSFTVAQLRRTWGREVYGGQGTLGAISGLVQFAVQGTILGVAANALSQIFKGQDPFSQWSSNMPAAVAAGFTRSGTASIMGDYLFSDFNRHGASVGAYALGPTFGNVEQFSKIYAKSIRGENPAGDVLSFARSILPFSNLLYTKLATDYLIWNGLTEAASPGYLSRMQRRLKETQGIEFLSKPVDMHPTTFRAF